mmetsp:Transcript_17642/g.43352  ORF Transcript_17642/g.43352 Transcript_17642/m.43352 type:complete len:256 (-) Transcript_17642:1-768(-)
MPCVGAVGGELRGTCVGQGSAFSATCEVESTGQSELDLSRCGKSWLSLLSTSAVLSLHSDRNHNITTLGTVGYLAISCSHLMRKASDSFCCSHLSAAGVPTAPAFSSSQVAFLLRPCFSCLRSKRRAKRQSEVSAVPSATSATISSSARRASSSRTSPAPSTAASTAPNTTPASRPANSSTMRPKTSSTPTTAVGGGPAMARSSSAAATRSRPTSLYTWPTTSLLKPAKAATSAARSSSAMPPGATSYRAKAGPG